MNEKKYLIWLDILGFGPLAQEIADKKDVAARKVRNDFIGVINARIEDIEKSGKITGKTYGESDDWLLVTDDPNKVFEIILEVLNHNTYYTDYEEIPLEIAIGVGQYDKWARFEGKELVIENSTIEFLKTYIVNHYRAWYKAQNNGQPIKSTFIILTESAYQELRPLDKNICQEIKYKDKKDGKEKEVTFFSADTEKFLLRAKGLKFAEKIGHPYDRYYSRVCELYVPPTEYEDIEKILREKKIVFITGTPEYGKTYTAIKLMWDYYNMDYEPRWIEGAESSQREKARERLQQIEAELRPGHILCFEDPFGKTEYEKRDDLERAIGMILNKVQQSENAYVIITSREEVFKEFEKERLSATEIKEFEEELNIKRPSYDYEKRKDILLKLAEEAGCKWLEDNNLKDMILRRLEDEGILPTPLNIKDFIIASIKEENQGRLEQLLKEKSGETAQVFAKEIQNMSEDKMLFLSFLFVSPNFEVDFIKKTYQELVQEMSLRNSWEFESILNWFKDDKITIKRSISAMGEAIAFSHSSYLETLEYLLTGYTPRFKEIFSGLLLKLSEKDKAAGDVAWAVAKNFDKLPDDVRNKLLLKLSEKDEAAWAVARAVAGNFDKLSEKAREELLSKLPAKVGRLVEEHRKGTI